MTIQQLQAENAEKDKSIQQLERSLSFARNLADGLKAGTVKQGQELYVLEERNRQLEAQNAEKDDRIRQLEAERDAAIEDLKYFSDCRQCNSWKSEENCRKCRPGKNWWQWRGIQKED